jgi:hypothetical protein
MQSCCVRIRDYLNPDLENETAFPTCHWKVVTAVAIRRSRCEGETRGNLNEILRSARNDTSCQIVSLRPEHHAVQGFARKDSILNRDLGIMKVLTRVEERFILMKIFSIFA